MLLIAIGSLAGCAQTVGHSANTAGTAAGKAAPRAVVNELTELSDPEQQKKLEAVARSPAVQSVSTAVGFGIGRGIAHGFVEFAVDSTASAITPTASATDPPENPGTTGPLPDHSSRRLAQWMHDNLEPRIAEIVGSAVRTGVAAAASPESRADDQAIAQAISQGAMRGIAREARENAPLLAQLIREQIGPAVGDAARRQLDPALQAVTSQRFDAVIHDLLQQEVVPAIRRAWDEGASDTLLIPTRPNMSPAVVENAKNLSLGTGYGTRDALAEMGVLTKTGGPTAGMRIVFWGLVVIAALIGLAAAMAIVVLVMLAISFWRRGVPTGR